VKNVLFVNALLLILFLNDTYGGRTHDKPIADATPYPLPAGSRLLQDLGFLAFTLPQVEILMPSKKPRGEGLTREQYVANQALHQRRLRIEHVNSSVKRCRIVKDRIRLWKENVRDLVMELCCALHNSGCVSRRGNQWFNRDKLNCPSGIFCGWRIRVRSSATPGNRSPAHRSRCQDTPCSWL
jgi:hypothetical protein